MSKKKRTNPIVTMVMPGRRALGEEWSKVTLYVDEDTDQITAEREDHAAPADLRPIFVPALANCPPEMVDYMIGLQMKEAEYRKAHPQGMPLAERTRLINEAWHAFVEQKLRWFRGQSQIGPGGMSQRERVDRNGR